MGNKLPFCGYRNTHTHTHKPYVPYMLHGTNATQVNDTNFRIIIIFFKSLLFLLCVVCVSVQRLEIYKYVEMYMRGCCEIRCVFFSAQNPSCFTCRSIVCLDFYCIEWIAIQIQIPFKYNRMWWNDARKKCTKWLPLIIIIIIIIVINAISMTSNYY